MHVRRNVPFFASLLDSIHASRALSPLLQTHAQLLLSPLSLSSHPLLLSKLSAAYARTNLPSFSLYLFLRCPRRPLFLYNSLLSSYSTNSLLSPCLSLYKNLLCNRNLDPKPETVASVLRAVAGSASLRHGKLLHCHAVTFGLFHASQIINSLISMYSKCGEIAHARKLFDEMPERSLVSYTAMMSGLAAHDCYVEALRLFDEMVGLGLDPDEKAMTAVLSACCNGGFVEVGERVFGEMEGRFGVRPTVEHYTCLVELLGRAGRVEEAERLVERMGFRPGEALLGALMKACKAHGKVEVALRVARRACSLQRS